MTRAERLAMAEESPGKLMSADVPAVKLAGLIAVESAGTGPLEPASRTGCEPPPAARRHTTYGREGTR
jgi:hypothetical protein